MKKIFVLLILVFLIFFFFTVMGCKTIQPTKEEQTTQQQTTTEEVKQEETKKEEEPKEEKKDEPKQEEQKQETEQPKEQTVVVFDEEEASKLLEKTKLTIAKAQMMGAEQYSSELFREAMDLFNQAEQIYKEKQNYAAYKEIIEKARAKAELAYSEAAEKRYQQSKEEFLKVKQQVADINYDKYYKDEFLNAELLYNQAQELKEKGDYVNAINKMNEATSIYKKVYETYVVDKNYVYSEFPRLINLQNELIDRKIKNIYPDDYNKFNEMFLELKSKIDEKDFKAAKELLQLSYIFGRNLLERYNQAISIINQTEASRYLFQVKEYYDIVKEKEKNFNDEQKKLLQDMEKLILEAEENFKNQKYYETIALCKEAMKIYVKLALNDNSKVTTYTVRLIPERRDCLWRIAGYNFIYNNPYLWPLIWIANLDIITNPDLIFPGQVLVIPPLPK